MFFLYANATQSVVNVPVPVTRAIVCRYAESFPENKETVVTFDDPGDLTGYLTLVFYFNILIYFSFIFIMVTVFNDLDMLKVIAM